MKRYILMLRFRSIVAAFVATMFTQLSWAGESYTVEIANFQYKPAVLAVYPGDKVTFINRDIVPHTATADDNSWDTGHIETDQSVTIEISEKMTLAYYCFYHRNMKARLEYRK